MMTNLSIKSTQKVQCINITEKLNEVINENKIKNGVLLIYVPHTTAALTINEGCDPDVFRDIVEKLDQVFPQSYSYHHQEGNSDAHIKASIIGNQRFVFVQNGQIIKGTWESIFFMEFDGPRNRRVIVSCIPTK